MSRDQRLHLGSQALGFLKKQTRTFLWLLRQLSVTVALASGNLPVS